MEKEKLLIKRADTDFEYHRSALLLSENEPWLSLGKTFDYTMGKIRDAAGELYVVYSGEEMAGCILIELRGNLRGFIRSFCIDPRFQGGGIGGRVIAYIEKLIFESYPNVFVFAASFNEGAIRFYERHGYERVGTFKDYVVRGSDEILFRKTIGPSNGFHKKYEKVEI